MSLRSGTLSLQEELCQRSNSENCESSGKGKCCDPYVHAPIDNFGVAGRWFRHKLLDGILVGTPVLLTIQEHRRPYLTTFMKALSFLGTEDFYTILFLLLSWIFDARLGRLFGILMGIGFYTTGYLKTLLCLPRPPRPPVVPLEKAFDWALPSHHSLLGVIMPWYIWLYTKLHYELSTLEMGVVCTLIVLWSFGVLFSRLYLGVHSPADIVCGGIVGVLVLSLWMQVDDYVDLYISQQRLEPQIQLILFFLFLLCLHPVAEPGNPSFCDTCILFGVVTGIVLGRSQRSRLLGMSGLLETHPGLDFITFTQFTLSRVVIGGICMLVTKAITKLVIKAVVINVFNLAGVSTYSSSVHRKTLPQHSKHYTRDFILPPIRSAKAKLDDDDDTASTTSSCQGDVTPDDRKSSPDDEDPRSWFSWMVICNTVLGLASRSKAAWDSDVPIQIVVYTAISFASVELIPRLFYAMGI
uniref:Phosphatidic acid phosphatase type 2/haloperoxidase domain-containing protein n=1 Tax=Ciona savignyi TaxID=51511 RepID=H2Y4T9_CIOSA